MPLASAVAYTRLTVKRKQKVLLRVTLTTFKKTPTVSLMKWNNCTEEWNAAMAERGSLTNPETTKVAPWSDTILSPQISHWQFPQL